MTMLMSIIIAYLSQYSRNRNHTKYFQDNLIWANFRTYFHFPLISWHLRRCSSLKTFLGLYSLRRRRLTGIGIPIINLRRSDDRLRFIMGIPILIRRHLLSEQRPWWKFRQGPQSLYSLSSKTSYHQTLWSLKALRFRLTPFQSLWNLTGTRQQPCGDACHISKCYDICNIQSTVFETSQDLAIRRLTA